MGRIESDAGHLRVVGGGSDGIAYGAASRRQPSDHGSSRSDTVQVIRFVVRPRTLTSPGSLPSLHGERDGHFDADRGGLRPAAGAHRPSSPPEGFLGRRGRSHWMGETSSGGDERGGRRGDPKAGAGHGLRMGSDRGRDFDRVDDRRLCPLRCAAVRCEAPAVIPRWGDGDEPRCARYEGAEWVGW